MKAKSVPVGKYLVNGEIIKFGKSELAVLSVPGHSPEAWLSITRRTVS